MNYCTNMWGQALRRDVTKTKLKKCPTYGPTISDVFRVCLRQVLCENGYVGEKRLALESTSCYLGSFFFNITQHHEDMFVFSSGRFLVPHSKPISGQIHSQTIIDSLCAAKILRVEAVDKVRNFSLHTNKTCLNKISQTIKLLCR